MALVTDRAWCERRIKKTELATFIIFKISFHCVSLFIKLSENGNNSFTSLGLFEIRRIITGHNFCCLFAVLIIYIRNFDMGKDKVKVHSR